MAVGDVGVPMRVHHLRSRVVRGVKRAVPVYLSSPGKCPGQGGCPGVQVGAESVHVGVN